MKIYIFIILLLGALSYIYLKLAIKFNIIDKPNQRSSHTKITVRGGGIIFPMAILLFHLIYNFTYPYLTLGILLIAIVSFLDDIYTLSSKIRFPFQFIAVFLILLEIGLPYSPIYMYCTALLFGVGIINMFNFMDGINGITGLYSLSVLFGFYFLNENEQLLQSDLIIYSIIALLIFGFYNFRTKALFFAGDIGSIAMGALVFFMGLYFMYYLESPLILLFVIVYGADAGNTLLYRKFFTQESIFEAHRHHIYQKLVDKTRFTHLQVSLLYAILQSGISVIIYKTYQLSLEVQWLLFFGLILVFTISYIILFRWLRNKVSKKFISTSIID